MADEPPYVVESPTRIRLSPLAQEMAKQNGMSLTEMAKHLLKQHAQREAGTAQREGEN
jgi:2,4-dienoyl-CoA reductase-like NADH-dependent reductase (Old Yellow Enzyme family)